MMLNKQYTIFCVFYIYTELYYYLHNDTNIDAIVHRHFKEEMHVWLERGRF